MFENFLSQTDEYIRSAPLLAFAAAYLAGVLTSFTPCVYPVIPITVGYIGARNVQGQARALISMAYVLGLAVVYAALGIIASLTGKLFGAAATHPLTYFIVANICLVFGLAMLDVFQIPMLGLTKGAVPTKKPGLLGAFAIGATSGLIIGPCTAPVLGAILIYVARQGNAVYGASLLFTFAVGMGTLLVFVASFAGLLASLPKSGPWLESVKKIFGFLLILAAEYLLIQMGGRL